LRLSRFSLCCLVLHSFAGLFVLGLGNYGGGVLDSVSFLFFGRVEHDTLF
jgi:hypothetical protein